MGREQIILKTKEILAEAQLNPPWKAVDGEPGERIQDSTRASAHRHAFIEKNLDYLASGDAILAAEAAQMLAALPEEAWDAETQRRYRQILEGLSHRSG